MEEKNPTVDGSEILKANHQHNTTTSWSTRELAPKCGWVFFYKNWKSERVRRVCAYEICVSAMRMRKHGNAKTPKRCSRVLVFSFSFVFSFWWLHLSGQVAFFTGWFHDIVDPKNPKMMLAWIRKGWESWSSRWVMKYDSCFRPLGMFSMCFFPKWRIPERGWY